MDTPNLGHLSQTPAGATNKKGTELGEEVGKEPLTLGQKPLNAHMLETCNKDEHTSVKIS